MESCNLNIVLHSAKNLRNVKHLGSMRPFAEVWISGDGMDESKQKTSIASHDGCDPVWNYSIDFENVLMKKSNTLFIDIKHHGEWMRDRNIGQVQVPFEDLLAGDAAANKVSYPVMIPSSNQTQGEVILSHRFKEVVSNPEGASASTRKPTTPAPRKTSTSAAERTKTAAIGAVALVASSVLGGATESLVTKLMSGGMNEGEEEGEEGGGEEEYQ